MYKTLKEIQKLNESDLRTKVLIPLFEKMGFKGIRHTHGPNEEGKDIVMYLTNSLKEREYYAVVAKAGIITGSATNNNNSANEVKNQIESCFDMEYDPIPGETLNINKVYVITSFKITSSGKKTIEKKINTVMFRNTEFFDGDKLFEHIEKHFSYEFSFLQDKKIKKEISNYNEYWDYKIEVLGDHLVHV
ncbi:MAG: hypothetical protein PF588_04385, partial [Candidatus Kapabacteria bacterium]|nr:hypothetical protein [Candidatus Kapabacteria bacterium]